MTGMLTIAAAAASSFPQNLNDRLVQIPTHRRSTSFYDIDEEQSIADAARASTLFTTAAIIMN